MAKIILDAGHGGTDPGAVYQGRQEKDDNLNLTLAVGEILKQNGIDVEYTRTEDVYQTPFEKAKTGNEAKADYFISFHRNSSPNNNQYKGAEVLIYDASGKKQELAENIVKALGNVGFREIGVKERPGLVVLRRTKMPAVLIETGFINNDEDNRIYDERFSEIAQEIAQAILQTVEPASSVRGTEMKSTAKYPCSCPCEEASPPADTYYRVQVGAYRERRYADRMLYRLQEQGFPAFLIYLDGYFKVQVGAYRELGNAIAMEQRLRQAGYPTLLVI